MIEYYKLDFVLANTQFNITYNSTTLARTIFQMVNKSFESSMNFFVGEK